jgi:DnaK suppressor protein
MDALQAQQMAQETARRRRVQLQKIDSALRRIAAGEYGHCLICGDEIDPARLDFDPACTRCTGCMEN